jgi:collagenase-like PrtC family protease
MQGGQPAPRAALPRPLLFGYNILAEEYYNFSDHMSNLFFSVPYNDDEAVLEQLFRMKSRDGNSIREVYMAGPQEYSGSGRITDEISLEKFISLLDCIHSHGLKADLVLNSTCEGTSWYSEKNIAQKMDYLECLHKDHGLEAVTIANPINMRTVRRRLPDIEICASVLSDIDCLQRAEVFALAGANIITPDVNINRNLELLKAIKDRTRTEIKLMVNEGCLYKCPFRKFHFNYISHKSREPGEIEQCFFFNCLPVICRERTQILKSGWIRPEDTSKYAGISNYFKIVGRTCASAMVVRAVRAYLEEKWTGDMLDLISGPMNLFAVGYGAYLSNPGLGAAGFFEKVTTCKNDCDDCDYCRSLIDRLLKLKILTQEKIDDLGPAGLQAVVAKVAEIERAAQ